MNGYWLFTTESNNKAVPRVFAVTTSSRVVCMSSIKKKILGVKYWCIIDAK